MQIKPLTFKNQYMFGRVLCQEDICIGFIECVLGLKVEKIDYLNREQVLEPKLDAKGVRLDVYVETDKGSFDIEMQIEPDKDLGRRLRFYQSSIDARLLDKGADYRSLKDSYVIFVCDYDEFSLDEAKYTFEYICLENPKAKLDHGSHLVILNSKAAAKAPNEPLSRMLEYIQSGCVEDSDSLVSKIDQEVQQLNKDAGWLEMAWSVSTFWEDAERRARYKIEDEMEELRIECRAKGLAEGRAEGRAEAEERYSKLVDILIKSDRISDLEAASTDSALREKLFQEFDL